MRMIAGTSQMQAGNQAMSMLPSSPYKTVQALVQAHVEVGVNTLHNIGSVLLGSLVASDGHKVGALKQQAFGAVPLADFDQGSLQNFPIGTIVGSSPGCGRTPPR